LRLSLHIMCVTIKGQYMENILSAGQDAARPAPKINTITCGDCLEVMQDIPDKSIDMILCDLPYGTTACKWDVVIPFSALWFQYKRICTKAIVLTCAQPFTSALIMSNIENFKYTWCWDKINGIRNHLNAKKQPMRVKEDVAIFYAQQPTYNPIMREGGYKSRKTNPGQSDGFGKVTGVDYGKIVSELYPVDIIGIEGHDPNNSLHPTQKPVALFEYLIRTYTNEGNTVLDNCIGSGTTAIACINTGRNYIGIEKEEKYCRIAEERIHALRSPAQNVKETAPNLFDGAHITGGQS
jgi:site-specific DNA-methyltransferase (adenine-specific)